MRHRPLRREFAKEAQLLTVADVRTQDRYPTRRGAESALLERTDPVVWPGVDSGPAGTGELAEHQDKGFHVLPGLLSPAEVQEHWQELERLVSLMENL